MVVVVAVVVAVSMVAGKKTDGGGGWAALRCLSFSCPLTRVSYHFWDAGGKWSWVVGRGCVNGGGGRGLTDGNRQYSNCILALLPPETIHLAAGFRCTVTFRFSYAAVAAPGGKREEEEGGDILLQSINDDEDAEYGGSLDEVR